jgi:hypothetical protein
MNLPTQDDLRAKLPEKLQNSEHATRLENLKFSLKKAYEVVKENNRKSHEKNKENYDKKAKERNFEIGEVVYLFCPAKEPGRCQKSRRVWQGPYKIIRKLSSLNYRIVDKKGKESVVHVNRLKKSHDQRLWDPFNQSRPKEKQTRPRKIEGQDEDEVIQSRPMLSEEAREPQRLHEPQGTDETRQSISPRPEQPQRTETPAIRRAPLPENLDSTRRDPNYEPSSSPRSRRELEATPQGPQVTKSGARLQQLDERTIIQRPDTNSE